MISYLWQRGGSLLAPNIVRFPAIVLADANIIHWLMWASPANPMFSITRLYNATKGTSLDYIMKSSKGRVSNAQVTLSNYTQTIAHISHSTGWRKIKWLLNEGLIILDKIIITPDGKKFSLYHSTLKSISV
jgi:hypothetical protein